MMRLRWITVAVSPSNDRTVAQGRPPAQYAGLPCRRRSEDSAARIQCGAQAGFVGQMLLALSQESTHLGLQAIIGTQVSGSESRGFDRWSLARNRDGDPDLNRWRCRRGTTGQK